MAQILGSLLRTWETQVEFLAPVFDLSVADIWEVKQWIEDLNFDISCYHAVFQVNKNK